MADKKNVDAEILEDNKKTKKVKKQKKDKKNKKEIEVVAPVEVETPEVLETSDLVVEETTEEVVVQDDKEEIKKEKKKRFWDEVKSFFIILIIIGACVLAVWLFVNYAKPFNFDKKSNNDVVDKNKDNVDDLENKEDIEVSYIEYETEKGSLEVINDKYLVEYNKNVLTKIMDLDLNILYENVDDTKYQIMEGIDGNIYALEYFNLETIENASFLYVLENEKLVQIKEFVNENTIYNLLVKDNYLVGVYEHHNEYLDDDKEEIKTKNIYHNLDGKEFDMGEISFESEAAFLSSEFDYVLNNDNYAVVKKMEQGIELYGLYDLKKGKVIVEPSFEHLYATNFDAFVAVKDEKTGIINSKRKVLVDYEYDFIDINKDYFVVSKDYKLGIMNKDFELVTDLEFYFQSANKEYEPVYDYKVCCASFNTFETYKYNDKYILTINPWEEDYGNLDYEKHETYIIDKDGSYITIKSNVFDISDKYATAYLHDSKEIVVYDTKKFVEISRFDFSEYDFEEYIESEIKGDTLVVFFDSELLYNIEDATEKDEQIIEYSINGAEIVIDVNDSSIKIYDGKKEIYSDEIKYLNLRYSFYNELNNGDIYYLSNQSYIKINKR